MNYLTKRRSGSLARVGLACFLLAVITILAILVACDNTPPQEESVLEYTVTFDSKGGSEVAAVKVKKGKTVAAPESPTKAGCSFKEWQLGGAKYDFGTPVTANIKLEAVWVYELRSLDILKQALLQGGEAKLVENLTVQEPLEVSKDLVLELQAGKTLTYEPISTIKTRLFTVKEDVMFTVKGEGKIVSTEEESFGLFDVLGKLVVASGTFESAGSLKEKDAAGNVTERSAVITGREGSEITIDGGTIFSTKFAAALFSDGKTTINDGLFKSHAYSTTPTESSKHAYAVVSRGEITVNGGEICGIHGAIAVVKGKGTINDVNAHTFSELEGTARASFYALYIAGAVDVSEVTIKGGKFKAVSQAAILIGNSLDGGRKLAASVTIEGGTFEGASYDLSYSKQTTIDQDGVIKITSGSFKHDKAFNMDSGGGQVELSSLLDATTYELEHADGWYKVVPKTT